MKIADNIFKQESVESKTDTGKEQKMKDETGSYQGIYQELGDLVGVSAAKKIWSQYKGQTISFPQNLYSREAVRAYIRDNMGEKKVSEIARNVGLSERRVRQIMKEIRAQKNEDFD